MLFSKRKMVLTRLFRKPLSITLIILTLFFSIFSLSARAQTTQSLYLNRVGFIDIEVGYDVHVVGDYAYVTNNDGLMIIDIQNPQNPQKVGEILSGGSLGFVVENDIAFITSVTNGFLISNISNPSSPQPIGQDSTGGAIRIAVSDSIACLTYLGGGFKVFNISDLSNPAFLGEFSDTRSDAIKIKDNIAYFANAEVGLKVVDISNPSTPLLITTVSQTGGANDIHITNDTLYLGCWGAGIRVIDISNPTTPQLLDSYDDNDGGEELGVKEKDDLLYVADNSGVELFDVSNPSSIIKIAERTVDIMAAHDLDVDEEYVYVAQGGGLIILEVSTTPEIEPWFIFTIIVIMSVAAVGSCIAYFKIIKPRRAKKEKI
ncbi:MAG: hypothetical protein KGD66_10640 [Candidatus Lokiarchaeota archaeon]|nr:hypothetical protein [Candidatus Lokiarchaeota archaeon]